MEIILNGLKIYYEEEGEGFPMLLLHGWGASCEVMRPMLKHFAASHRVICPDLPGFGKSEEPAEAWSVYDYASFVVSFAEKLGLERPILLGHSFGGRLSVILGSQGFADKMILTDAAGIRPKRSASYYAKVYTYKAVKRIMDLPVLNNYREQALAHWQRKNTGSDYQTATGVMRQIFVKVVNEDLTYLLPKITASVLLIWGDLDTATPLSDGKLMEKLIPDAGLVVFEGCGHFCFAQQPDRYHRVVDYFLEH